VRNFFLVGDALWVLLKASGPRLRDVINAPGKCADLSESWTSGGGIRCAEIVLNVSITGVFCCGGNEGDRGESEDTVRAQDSGVNDIKCGLSGYGSRRHRGLCLEGSWYSSSTSALCNGIVIVASQKSSRYSLTEAAMGLRGNVWTCFLRAGHQRRCCTRD